MAAMFEMIGSVKLIRSSATGEARMRYATLGSILAATVLVAVNGQAADFPTAPRPRPAGFTAEKAKQALIGLMETRDGAPVCRADIKKFAEVATEVREYELGVADWGPFT